MRVQVELKPWVCMDCGNLDLMSDAERSNKPSKCRSCKGENIKKAGDEQLIEVEIYAGMKPYFDQGETE